MKAWRLLGQLFSRAGLSHSMGKTFGGDRDLWPTLGYRESADVNTYLSFYKRGDVAARIIDLPADASWQFEPEVRLEDKSAEGQSFIDEVAELNDRVRLWAHMAKADRVSGIGQYGVLFLGLRTESAAGLAEPAAQMSGGLKDLLFVRALHEKHVEIKTWVEKETDPRFGLPETYEIEFSGGATDKSTIKKIVHWTRVIHIAENTIDDDTYGTPRLERVLNRLDDLNKAVGSSAEIFWLAIAGILHADLDPDIDVDSDDMEAFEKDIIEAMHGIRRLIQTRGVTLNRIASSGNVDPQPVYEAIKELIAAAAGIPERVLFGSERGELASSQDQRQWYSVVKSRQSNHVAPVIVRPFFDRLEALGALTQPEGWELYWPPLDEPTELELADIAEKKSKAAVALAPGGQGDILIKPWEARELLGFTPIPEEPPKGAEEAFAEGVDMGSTDDEPDEEELRVG